MTTIKAYTDLEQSKKLAEILPLESADIHIGNYVGKSGKVDGTNVHYYFKGESFGAPEIIDAWSLAALLDVLPRSIEFKGDKYYIRFMKEYVEYANDEISITGRCLHTTGNHNLVDACYEMILKLHELNLL